MPWPKGKSTSHLQKWDKEQEQYVIDNYDGNGSALAEVLPFSPSAIRNDVWGFLEILYPYLKVKREKAIEVLQIMRYRHDPNIGQKGTAN